MTPEQQKLVERKLYTRYCDDPDNCTYSDCPTAFCDRTKAPPEPQKLIEALRPFVLAFERKTRAVSASTARSEWNERMPDHFPITITLTMGDCRRAVSALREVE